MANQVPDGYVEETIPIKLIAKRCAFVEPIRPSGMTSSGIFVIDQESNFATKTSMMVRVIGLGPECSLEVGKVYVVPVYAWDDFPFQGEVYHIMHEANAQAEIEGYDECSTELMSVSGKET